MAAAGISSAMQICLVTGGTSGIGLITARELLRGGARVVITSRDAAKGAAVAERLARETGNANVEVLACDFASLDSIRAAAAEFRRRHDRLHVLVNNAGGLNPKRALSKDGLELTFAVNHLGYFLLTDLLLDVLKASAPARVVSVASEASRVGRIDFDDLQASGRYSATRQYGANPWICPKAFESRASGRWIPRGAARYAPASRYTRSPHIV